MKKILILFTIVFISVHSAAQFTFWENYTNTTSINSIEDDGDYLWVGTHGGLVKFDKKSGGGVLFTHANSDIPDNHIFCVKKDLSGNLWLNSRYSGLGKFDGKRCTVFNSKNSGLPVDQLGKALAFDAGGNVWLGALYYVTKYNLQTWKVTYTGDILSASNSVNSIKFGKNGVGYIGASWGLGKIEGDSIIEKYAGIKDELNAIEIDKNNTLWLGTNRKGLIKLDGQTQTTFTMANSKLPGNTIYDLKFDSKNNLWLCTENGIARFDGTDWQVFNSGNTNIPDDYFFTLTIDKNDVVWIGSRNSGLVKYDGITWKAYPFNYSPLPCNHVYALKYDGKENLWFGTYKGLLMHNKSGWTLFDTSNSKLTFTNGTNIDIFALEYDKAGNLWIGFRGTPWLAKYDGVNWVMFDSSNSPLKSEMINVIKADNNNNIWIGTENSGIIKYDGKNWVVYNNKNSPLTSNFVVDIEQDKSGAMWFGVRSVFYVDLGVMKIIPGGLFKLDGTQWTRYGTDNSLIPDDNVSAVAIDAKGNIWISNNDNFVVGKSYGKGLTKFDGTKWTTFNMSNSFLPSNTVWDIKFDKDNNLWLATCDGGIALFNGNDYWAVFDKEHYGIATNSPSSIEIDKDNTKWIASYGDGLSVFIQNMDDVESGNEINTPKDFVLMQNYPNPFNPATTIKFTVAQKGYTTLKVFDMLGRQVSTVFNSDAEAGKAYNINFNAAKLASGVYLYQLQQGSKIEMRKMLLLK